ncbi:MAG: hypothetical protein JHD02_06300 [Thermoleophilaceae bacterium]|nr:hypothetical protein [Thermoleophilaceae bacterium]
MSEAAQTSTLERADEAVRIEKPSLHEVVRRTIGEVFAEARAAKLTVLAIVVAAITVDWAWDSAHEFVARHSLLTAFVTDALTLTIAYVLIDSFISARRELNLRPVLLPAARRMLRQADQPGRVIVKEINRHARAEQRPTFSWKWATGPRKEIEARRAERREYCVAGCLKTLQAPHDSLVPEMQAASAAVEELIDDWAPLAASSPDFQYVLEAAWNARSAIVQLYISVGASERRSGNPDALKERLVAYLERRDELSDAMRHLDPNDGFKLDPTVKESKRNRHLRRARPAPAT